MTWLNWFGKAIDTSRTTARRPRKHRPLVRRLEIETLEERLVPTVVFTPHYGSETITQRHDDQALHNPNVYLIFNGPYWNTQVGQQDVTNLRTAASSILGGSYLNGLRQYGSDGRAQYRYSLVNPPGTTMTAEPSTTDLQSYLQGVVGWSAFLPPPDYNGQPAIYVVVTTPGVIGTAASGYNTQGQWVDPATHQSQNLNMVWVSTAWTSTWSVNPLRLVKHAGVDYFTQVFSHEIAEDISDPGGRGVHIAPPAALPAALRGDNQIGDNEPAWNYEYRVNGYLVQAYWSDNDRAFIVPDGNLQNFYLNGLWNEATHTVTSFSLILDGLASTNVITIQTSPTTGGVLAKLNGAVAEFDYNVISKIRIDTWGAHDGIWVQSVPANTPVDVHSYGQGSDNYVTVGVGSVTDWQNSIISVSNDFGQTHLRVIDNSDTGRHFGIYSSSIVIDGLSLGWIQYSAPSTDNGNHGVVGIEIWGGLQSANDFEVGYMGGQTALTLHGGPKGDVFHINGLDGIDTLNIDNWGNNDQIVVDDRESSDAAGAFYQIDSNGLTRFMAGTTSHRINLVPTRLGAAGFQASLTLYPFDGDHLNILGTTGGFPVEVHAASGDTVVVACSGGIFTGGLFPAPVTVDGSSDGTTKLALFDAATTAAGDYTVTNTTVGRTGSAAVTYSNVQTLEVDGSNGANVFHILSTAAGATTTVNGGTAGNQFLVSDPNTTLDSIQGPLSLNGQGSANDSAVFDDSGNPIDQAYTLAANSLARGGMATISFAGLTAVTLKTGQGSDVVALLNLAGGPAFALDGGAGSNKLDYSSYPGDAVIDFAAGTATGLAGGIANFQTAAGGPGNDPLPGADGKIHLDAALAAIARSLGSMEGAGLSDVLASFTDGDANATADQFTARIAWGDGTVADGSVIADGHGGFNVVGSHTYAEEGSYSPAVHILDQAGSTADVTATVQVSDAPLAMTGTSLAAVQGQPLANVALATFTDANPGAQPGDFTVTIDWGDGTTGTGKVTANADGSFSIFADAHTFSTHGAITIGVTLQDAGGASAAAQTAVFVDAVTASGTTLNAVAGSAVTGLVASFTSAQPNAQPGDFTATILWDANDPNAVADTNVVIAYDSANQVFTVSGNHVYTVAGAHAMRVTIQHTGGASADVLTALTVSPANASRFLLTGLSPTTAGLAQNATVTTLDAYGNVATGYAGTVHFAGSDAHAALPADYAFTAGDAGVHTFAVTLFTAGSQTVTATDTSSASIAGSQAGIAVAPAAASKLLLTGFPGGVSAGVAQAFTVTAQDAFGNVATGYAGKVHVSSSDMAAVLPADYTFTAADHGTHTFQATLKTAGAQSLTVKDLAGNFGAVKSGINVNPAASFRLAGLPANATAGATLTVTITALDVSGKQAANYQGTVRLRASDGQAVLPATYTFTAADKGVHTFTIVFKTAGSQTLTVTDSALAGVIGKATLTVNPGAATKLVLSGLPASVTAGQVQTVTVTVRDAYGNIATGYTGTVNVTSSDKQAVLPAAYKFQAADKGVHTFRITFKTVSSGQTLTVGDTLLKTLTVTQTIAVK